MGSLWELLAPMGARTRTSSMVRVEFYTVAIFEFLKNSMYDESLVTFKNFFEETSFFPLNLLTPFKFNY